MRREVLLQALLLGAMALCGTLGCQKAPDVVPVHGRVVIAGQDADNISVQFVPDSAGEKPFLQASAVTDSTGKFSLQCEDGRPGAVPGKYHVLLEDLKPYANPRNDEPTEKRKDLIVSRLPQTYRSAGSTPLKVTVEPQTPEITLEVKP